MFSTIHKGVLIPSFDKMVSMKELVEEETYENIKLLAEEYKKLTQLKKEL